MQVGNLQQDRWRRVSSATLSMGNCDKKERERETKASTCTLEAVRAGCTGKCIKQRNNTVEGGIT